MRILVIEDEPELLELIASELEDAGHHVIQAQDGVEGLSLATRNRFDVICSDVNMPYFSGIDLKRELDRGEILASETRFIFISAQATDDAVADGLAAGAAHYVTKPIDFDRLARLIGPER